MKTNTVMRVALLSAWLAVMTPGYLWAAEAAATSTNPTSPLAFKTAGEEFVFDTGLLRGKLRAEKRGFGLTSVIHAPSKTLLSRGTGLFGIYRVFSDGKRYGNAAWEWPGEASVQADGSVRVKCAATPERPFALDGRYRWATPAALDFEITVKAERDLSRFEAFLSSYFDSAFTHAMAYVTKDDGAEFMRAQKSSGDWLMFPRDEQAVSLIQDGRWTLAPNPVDWVIMPRLSAPMGIRRMPSTGLTVAIMTPARDCFALAMPYEAEGHYSMYFSLFGRDIKANETARATARLQVFDQADEQRLTDGYAAFVRAVAKP